MVFFNVNGETFRIHGMCLKAIGVWPLDGYARRSKIVFSITVLTQMVIILTCLTHPLPTCYPDKSRKYHGIYLMCSIFGVLSQIALRVCGRAMILLIETTTEDWLSTTDPIERDIMNRHNRIGAVYVFSSLIYLIVWCPLSTLRYLPFINRLTSMDEREGCEVNDDSIWYNLLPYLSYSTWLYSNLVMISGSLLYGSFAMHISSQYKILQQQCQDFLNIKEKEVGRKEFRRIVKKHNELLDLSGHLEDSFTVFAAILIFVTQAFICVMTYQLVSGADAIFSTSSYSKLTCIYFLANGIFNFYYAADYLTACCKEIGEVFKQSNWYELPKESRINFSIVIARCKKPKKLTAVKIYKLNLWNLKYVFNGLYSYMSCIIAVVGATRK